jgi:hypothetical protein
MRIKTLNEYFVVSRSFQAPLISDTIEEYVKGEDPRATLEMYAADYGHAAGLYAANLYRDADAYHRAEEPLAIWWCNKAIYQDKQMRMPHDVNPYVGELVK